MAARVSAGGNGSRLRLSDWLLASPAVWLGAMALGAAMVALGTALSALMGLGTPEDYGAHPLVALFVTGYILLFSQMFSWLGIILALPAVWLLLRGGGRAAGPVSRCSAPGPAPWQGC